MDRHGRAGLPIRSELHAGAARLRAMLIKGDTVADKAVLTVNICIMDLVHAMFGQLKLMNVHFLQLIDGPANPARIVPLLEKRQIISRIASFRIMPGENATRPFLKLPRFYAKRLWKRNCGIGNLITTPVWTKTPAMIGASDERKELQSLMRNSYAVFCL